MPSSPIFNEFEDYFQRLEDAFDLTILNFEILPSGYNRVYKLKTDKGTKALKISEKFKRKEHTLFEHGFLKSLIEYGFDIVPAPLQIYNPDSLDEVVGDTIAVIDNRLYSIFNWLDGNGYDGSFMHLFGAGVNLANYHQVAASILENRLQAGKTDYQSIRSEWGDITARFPPIGAANAQNQNFSEDLWSAHIKRTYKPKIYRAPSVFYNQALQNQASPVDKLIIDCVDFVDRKIEEVRISLFKLGFRCNETENGLLYYFPLPKAIAHSDYAPQNIKFDGNKVNVMLDFDNANARERAYDIAWALATFCANDDQSLNYSKISSFLDGYLKISKLSSDEIAVLPYEIYTRCIETMYWPVEKYYSGKPYRLDYALKDYAIIRWLDTNEKELTKFICRVAQK